MNNEKNESDRKTFNRFLAASLSRVSQALSRELSVERMEIYIESLANLSEDQARHAFAEGLKVWTAFPSIAEIQALAETWTPEESHIGRQFRSVDDIDPERCPKGWTPADVFAAHLTQEKIRGAARRPLPIESPQDFPTVATLGRQAGISPEQVKNWLDGGKDAQAEFMSRMESDSEWIALAGRLGAFAGLSAKLPKTVVPADPAERKTWATKRAETQGWR